MGSPWELTPRTVADALVPEGSVRLPVEVLLAVVDPRLNVRFCFVVVCFASACEVGGVTLLPKQLKQAPMAPAESRPLGSDSASFGSVTTKHADGTSMLVLAPPAKRLGRDNSCIKIKKDCQSNVNFCKAAGPREEQQESIMLL